MGGGCDGEVELRPSRVAATAGHRGGKLTPDPSDLDIHRKGVEGRFDHGQSGGASRSLVIIVGDQDTQVQLGYRDNANSRLEPLGWGTIPYEHRCVEQDPHGANGSTTVAASRSRSASNPRETSVRQMPASVVLLTQRRRCTGPSSATGRPATVTVRVSPASARRRTSLILFRSSFCAMSLTALW